MLVQALLFLFLDLGLKRSCKPDDLERETTRIHGGRPDHLRLPIVVHPGRVVPAGPGVPEQTSTSLDPDVV